MFEAKQNKTKAKITKNKQTGIHRYVIPWVPRSLVSLPSPHFSESSYICLMHNIQSFELYLEGRIEKKMFTPYSCKQSFSIEFYQKLFLNL